MGRIRLGALLLVAGLGLFIVCWAFTNPVGAAPDEQAHYVKALGVASGDLVGAPVTRAEIVPVFGPPQIGYIPDSAFGLSLTRRVHIPANLDPGAAGCTAFDPAPATCVVANPASWWAVGDVGYTYVGTYQPLVYLPAGMVMSLASTPTQAFIAGRLMFGFLSLLLIVAGACLLLRLGNRAAVLTGILVALTPMVLFTIATVSSSSIEIAAGFATIGAVLHLAFDGDRPRAAWVLVGIAGSVLAMSRSLGPLWLALAASVAVLLLSRRGVGRVVRRHVRLAVAMIALAAAGAVAGLAWQLLVQPRHSITVHDLWVGGLHGVQAIGSTLHEEIGVFGWLDTQQVGVAYVAWGALVVGLLVVAWLAATTRERWTLVALVAANLLVIPVVYDVVAAPLGSGVQGRWFLPFATVVPVFCGVVIARRPTLGLEGRRWALGVAAVVTVVQFLALYQNARRYAVGPGGRFVFLSQSGWAPAHGWALWLGAGAIAATAALAGAALVIGPVRRAGPDQDANDRVASITAS